MGETPVNQNLRIDPWEFGAILLAKSVKNTRNIPKAGRFSERFIWIPVIKKSPTRPPGLGRLEKVDLEGKCS